MYKHKMILCNSAIKNMSFVQQNIYQVSTYIFVQRNVCRPCLDDLGESGGETAKLLTENGLMEL